MTDSDKFEIYGGWWLIGYNGTDKTVKIPDGVKEISFRAFLDRNIEYAEIPASVDFIDVQAFLGCARLKRIVIPLNVKGVEYAAFEDCDSLSDIFLEAHEIPHSWSDSDWLQGCNASVHCAGEWAYVDGEPTVIARA